MSAIRPLLEHHAAYRGPVRVGDRLLLDPNPWDVGYLPYTSTMYVAGKSDTAPRFGWEWDASQIPPEMKPSVVAYPSVRSGLKPWDRTRVDDRLADLRVSQLNALAVTYAFRSEGEGSYNAAFDLLLTRRPDGTEADIAAEVMVWVYRQGERANPAGRVVWSGIIPGTASSADLHHAPPQEGRPWDCYTFCCRYTEQDGEIDFAQALNWLAGRSARPDLYVGSVEFGAEAWSGSRGVMVVDAYDLEVKRV